MSRLSPYRLTLALVAGCLFGASAEVARAAAPPCLGAVSSGVTEAPPARVGQIIIVGNECTRQDVILRELSLYPGQVLTYADVRLGEKNLARLGIFEVNGDVRPTIKVLDNPQDPGSEFKDLLVTVQETATGSLTFGVGVNSDVGLTGSIVLQERNFDLLRWPASLDDLLSGGAFRGAGQEFRVEVSVGTHLPRFSVRFHDPAPKETIHELTGWLEKQFQAVFATDEEPECSSPTQPVRRCEPISVPEDHPASLTESDVARPLSEMAKSWKLW